MINFLKKYAAQFIAAAVLVSGTVVSVAAATNKIPVTIKGGSTSYIEFTSQKMYSGIVSYTSSESCTSQKAKVKLTRLKYSSDGEKTPTDTSVSVNVATYSASGNDRISASNLIRSGTEVEFSSAANYPTQYIKAGFSKSGFNGVYYLTGKFYYDGT